MPNRVASSLALRRTNTIVLFVNNLLTRQTDEFHDGVEEVCAENSFLMLLQKLGDDRERKARYIQLLREQRVDGMIVVPDVAVATFDDDLFASYLETSLTSVYWPAFEIGRVAAQTLLRRIRGEVIGPPQRMLLEPTLIHRESTLGGTTVRSA